MAWDNQGRMWIFDGGWKNYTYGSRKKVRFDLSLRDRVIVLSDMNGDGQADTRKVFTDKVQMLTSVEVDADITGGNGEHHTLFLKADGWLMCPLSANQNYRVTFYDYS